MSKKECKILLFFTLIALIAIIYKVLSPTPYDIQQTEVVVKDGDTLWEIAEEYCPSQDPRKITYQIKQDNALERPIRAGDRLVIPKEVSRGKNLVVEATAYTHTGNKTYTGVYPETGRTIAVDPDVIPLGSRVIIDGHTYIAEDTGGAIKGNVIDIFLPTTEECIEWGRQVVEVVVIE